MNPPIAIPADSPSPTLLHLPGEPEYEDACTLFNSMIDIRPRLVARCNSPADVTYALAYARAEGLPVAVRAGGHSVAGDSLVEGGLVLDVRGLDAIEVDAERRAVRVGAGCTLSQLDRATQPHGLHAVGGRVSTTGVAGLTLGGGSGWLERKHGLACDNLLAVEMVTARGELVRADEEQNPELLWAMRGGGGNFGVVTAMELRLHPLPEQVLAGFVLHPPERATEALALYRDVMESAPDELSLAFAFMTAPDEDGVPAELRGKPAVLIGGLYAGDIADGAVALTEIRSFGPPALDAFEPMPYADMQCLLDDPPGFRNWWTAEHLAEMSDEAIDVIAERSARIPAGPAMCFIVAWGGAVERATPADSPLGGRDARFVVHPLFLWEDAADDEAMIELGRGYRDDLAPFATGDTYLNFIGHEGTERVRRGFAPGAYERLAQVKAEWDPENVFSRNQNVAPALEPAAG